MGATLQVLHWIAGFIALAEALNKLERAAPFAPGLTAHARVVAGLKAFGLGIAGDWRGEGPRCRLS